MSASKKVTVVFKRVHSDDSGGEDALNRVLSALLRGGLENDCNDDVVSVRESKDRPRQQCFDITLRVGGI